ncbi:hypothetical protein PDR5_03840 [Pseudomonas sp. DR 5-09]|nr:hypothetical protein PDR5_03840 [Pseudomonas sp. DR 5-09]
MPRPLGFFLFHGFSEIRKLCRRGGRLRGQVESSHRRSHRERIPMWERACSRMG